MQDLGPLAEERIAGLIAELPPAPPAWVEAAALLPAARRELERLVELARADAAVRDALLADVGAAFRRAGVPPTRMLVRAARVRLSEDRY
ncbi:MAG TPA: hypothetical protein VLA98_02525 [Solirubrobacteraceae bacterium]|nr:hypothetical protein [Solirubrobacteraceae bacterium]